MRRSDWRRWFSRELLALAAFALCAGCATPRVGARPAEPLLDAGAASTIAALIDPLAAARPGHSGVALLDRGAGAFALRAQSAALAGRSLDIQYYIWHDDVSGRELALALLEAADRGVRVRILLDDFDARGKRMAINALDAHPRIAVRLFNPLGSRGGALRGAAETGLRFGRLNHRMHNKAWIADGRLAIVGGRNIGDEYFSASAGVNFADLDLALFGPAAGAFERGFERYWNDEASLDLAQIDDEPVTQAQALELRERIARERDGIAHSALRSTAAAQPSLAARVAQDTLWSARVEPLIDDPRKIRADGVADPGVLEGLRIAFDAASTRLALISPYFVPGDGGVSYLAALHARGVHVSVLTNSLAATDVAAVHGGYSRSRPALLDAGIELHEMRPQRAAGSGGSGPGGSGLGSSSASLHGKAAIIDGERVFVGSFNLDPRSAHINCEQGVLVDSRELAAALGERLAYATADGSLAWRVERDTDGDELRWIGRADEPVVTGHDPEASTSRRFRAWLARALGLESQL